MDVARVAQLFIDGSWVEGTSTSTLVDKYGGAPVAEVHAASDAQVDAACDALAGPVAHDLAPAERSSILGRASELFTERHDLVVRTIVADSGFTVTDATREANRAVGTLRICAEEAKRISGEMVPIDGTPGVSDRIAFTIRRPVGVVCAISPFNSPLNTLLHKVGPAIAAGNAVVIKPASATPLTAALTVELLLEAGLPPARIALVNGGGGTVGNRLLEHPAPAFYAFTGSTEVGAHILRTIGLRKHQLELGSLASTIVTDSVPPEAHVARCADAAFRKAGRICTSIQRLYLHDAIYDAFADGLVAYLATKVAGDPTDPATYVGPLIDPNEADRVEKWIEAAVGDGAKVASGGKRVGNVIEPTVLVDVDAGLRVMTEEIFGPVVCLRRFSLLQDAIDEVNDTPYGLATGIFTNRIDEAMSAAMALRVGSVHINETSNGRLDVMPYGGVKASGLGQEGPRYAIREMTEERLVSVAW